ncbi:MAG TPA: fibronectin type III domain-containing protein, partial [Candidatus Diapherotrites archaeon]|nr:fibronectin type III domain-containing protein [Candidatus Diapherotrites archaeon]
GIFGYHGTDTFPWFFAATKDMVFGSRTYHGGDFFIGEIDSAYLWWQYDEHKLIIAGDISISGDIESSNFEYDPFTGTLVGYKLEYYGGNAYFGGAIVSGNSFITGNTSIYGNNVTIAGQSIVNVGNVSDSTALTIPAGLLVDGTAITIANDGTISANITLSWTAETDPRFDHYQIRYKKSSFTYYQYISSNSNTITIDGLTPNTSYDFAVSSVNKYGIPSTYSSTVTYTTATSTTAPAKVSGVSAVGGIQYVIVEWISNSEKDLSSYNVYRNTVNNSETATLISNIKGNYLVDGNLVGGTQYFYWVKAVNTSGLVSTNFSTVVSATPRNVVGSDTVISQRGWTQTCIFSSTSATQVNWGAGKFIASDGTTYNILAGNTGVMTARTYIFLDIDVSTTQYQITTVAGNAVGNNRVLIGSAINGTIEATFTIFSGDGAIKISKEGLEDGSIDLSKFSNGLTPVEVLDILPTENNFDGRMVFLTTDKKLYRYNAIDEEFTTAVPTTDLTGTIVKEQIADGSIDLSKFSNGLTPIEVLDTLPVDNNFDGRIVFLTTDKKLYRYNATEGEFTAAVPTTDLTGTITGEQIAGGSIDLSKFGSGLTPVEVLDTLPTENNFDGRIVFLTIDKKLYRYDGTQEEFTAAVPTTDLTGTIVETQIADNSISTGKIKANAITANEIAAGTITGNKIAANTIEAGNIATGTITANEIAAQTIETGNIKAGAITANEIAVGTITGNKIAAGTIEAGNIAAGTITGNEIAANTIEAGNIKAGTITTVELNFTPVKDTNVIASINASEEGIDISASKIATISAEKILIDGTTYLSNWRKSGDLTKIDGGSISTGSITTTQLNFTPVIDGTIIASINASEEGIKISGEHIEISGSTSFSSGYDPTSKVDKLGGSYATASSGARVLIFPDTNTGLQIIDNGGADVFKAIIGGTNVGDVIIGNYTGGQGIFYDKSEAKTIFKGSMIAGNITGVTITGGTIQTAISGKRVEIKTEGEYENSIAIFDSTGNIGIHLFDNSIFGGWTNSAIIFDQSYGLRVAFPFPTSDQGYIYFLRNSSQSYGAAAPIITGYPSLAIEVDSITLNGTTRTSWPTSFSGNLSDLSINTAKNWGSYGITGLGTITPYSNNSYSLGSSSYKWNNVYSTYGTFDYLGKSLNANTYGITGLGTITPYSNNSCDLGSSSYYWRNVYGINIIPSGSYTSYLGNSSYYWDYFYVDTIRGAGGTNSIEIENNAFTRYLFPASNVTYDIGGSGLFYKNVFTQSLRLRTGQSTNPSYSGEIRYYDATGGGFRGMVGSLLKQFDMTAK